jgi:hypothetical protein
MQQDLDARRDAASISTKRMGMHAESPVRDSLLPLSPPFSLLLQLSSNTAAPTFDEHIQPSHTHSTVDPLLSST